MGRIYVTGSFLENVHFQFLLQPVFYGVLVPHNETMVLCLYTGNESKLSQDYSDVSDGASFFTES